MKLIYENQLGETLDLLNSEYWLLDTQDGLTSLPANSITQKNTILTEGSFVQNRKREARQIVLNHTFVKNVRSARRRFIDVLDQEQPGKLRYIDDEIDVFIEVEVESCEIDNTSEKTKAVTTLLAPYPYFLDVAETRQYKKSVQGMFSFPFTFDITFGTTNNSNSLVIENTGQVDVGFEFILTAKTGAVSNIIVSNEVGEYAKLTGLSLIQGDVVKFSSLSNEKYITQIRDGVETNLLGYFEGSFFLMHKGYNKITLSATGAENATLEVISRGAHKAV